MDDDNDCICPPVFADPNRRKEFWERFEALTAEFPEMFDGFEKILEGQMDERGILFDPDSPRYIQAAAVVISVRNVDHWESIFMVDPPEQSRYMTKGLIEAAAEMA